MASTTLVAFIAVGHDSRGSMQSWVTVTRPNEPGTRSQKLGRKSTMRDLVGRARAMTQALKLATKAPASAPPQAGASTQFCTDHCVTYVEAVTNRTPGARRRGTDSMKQMPRVSRTRPTKPASGPISSTRALAKASGGTSRRMLAPATPAANMTSWVVP